MIQFQCLNVQLLPTALIVESFSSSHFSFIIMTSNTNNSSSKKSDSKEDGFSQCDYKPHNLFVNACLTDLYQITMTYAYWKNQKVDSVAVFDLFFRKCPFKGEFCIFSGLDDVLRFLNSFHYSKQQISLLRKRFPRWDSK